MKAKVLLFSNIGIPIFYLTIFFFKLLFISGCSNALENKFIEIRHFAATPGITYTYKLNGSVLQVSHDCDFEPCESKIVYTRSLNRFQSKKLYSQVLDLRLDTLRRNYRAINVLGGLESSIKIRGYSLYEQKIFAANSEIPALDSLYKIVDTYIDDEIYKFYYDNPDDSSYEIDLPIFENDF